MTFLWVIAVGWASPKISVESASLKVASGTIISVDGATKIADSVAGEGVRLQQDDLVISADSTQWSMEKAHGIFEGNVHAVQADLRFTSQRVEVQLGEDGSIVHALATGGVTVQQANRMAVGSQATFADGRLVLTGQPIVRQAGSEMSGTQIVFVVGKDTIECTQCIMTVKPASGP